MSWRNWRATRSEAALQDSVDEIVNAALKTLPPSVLEQVTVTAREDPPSPL